MPAWSSLRLDRSITLCRQSDNLIAVCGMEYETSVEVDSKSHSRLQELLISPAPLSSRFRPLSAMTVTSSQPTSSPHIRLVRPDDQDDITDITALGRYVFYTTFAHTTSSSNMLSYLNNSYTLDIMRKYVHAPDMFVYVAEVDLNASADDCGKSLDTSVPEQFSLKYPQSSRPRTTKIVAWVSLCTSSTALNRDIFPSDDNNTPWPSPIELRTIHVHPAFHGQGLARRLIDQTISHARTAGHASLWLGVYPENARAIRFYQKCGFVKMGQHEFKVGDQVDMDDIMAVRVDREVDGL